MLTSGRGVMTMPIMSSTSYCAYTLYNSKIRDRDSTIDELDYGQTIHANIHHEAEKGTTFLF